MNIKESIQQINELIEAWELNEACLNQTDIDAIKCLLKQNKELKQKYLNAVADYETTMFEKEQLNSLVNSCQEEIRQLKKQVNKGLYNVCLPYQTGYNNAIKDKETQQKEFIKWLEDESKEVYRDGWLRQNIFKQVLQKYKEIMGDDK